MVVQGHWPHNTRIHSLIMTKISHTCLTGKCDKLLSYRSEVNCDIILLYKSRVFRPFFNIITQDQRGWLLIGESILGCQGCVNMWKFHVLHLVVFFPQQHPYMVILTIRWLSLLQVSMTVDRHGGKARCKKKIWLICGKWPTIIHSDSDLDKWTHTYPNDTSTPAYSETK